MLTLSVGSHCKLDLTPFQWSESLVILLHIPVVDILTPVVLNVVRGCVRRTMFLRVLLLISTRVTKLLENLTKHLYIVNKPEKLTHFYQMSSEQFTH